MVSGQTTAIVALASLIGGMYVASMRASNKMCANAAAFNAQMTAFEAGCPATPPNTLDVMRYFVL